ncbi:glycoside hydrolase family 43 protein [Canariomyces notabilis]|uniref:Glycoside hydrolase family 43 protein n=1 Tax=Canariomyces notabilis TaxID=2074819 RepID=A0AAN6TF40_9PEZI|nr:glycoside hydrolase family 43 protein [Canariomyces arenarius]
MYLPRLLLLTPFLTPFSSAQSQTLTNPIIWQDHPDLDVFRIGSVFYYSSSTFAYSPGAPVLRSYNLADWEPVSHSVPTLNFGPEYNLPASASGSNPSRAYVKGIWASTLRYRASTDTFYWLGCINSGKTYVWTASGTQAGRNDGEVPEGKWNWTARTPINTCYYDVGMLIDNDPAETVYVAYGNRQIRVARLNVLSNGDLSEATSQVVYNYTGSGTVEGARMYKVGGRGPFGPYTMRTLVDRPSGPVANAGFAHQGGIVDTQDGRWYYVAFLDAYPGGRIPVAAPLIWGADGWPRVEMDARGAWGREYPVPVNTSKTVKSRIGEVRDEFKGERLGHGWEWNHNPDNGAWAMAPGGGLTLRTATVTGDLFAARNTLTHRIQGPKSRGTFRVDISKMRDGDRAGAVLFRDRAAYIGIHKTGSSAVIVMVNNLNLTVSTWQTSSMGSVAATGPTVSGREVWLRIQADITPAFGTTQERRTTFSYSLDGTTFTTLGPAFAMTNDWRYFTGYRYGVFNFATKALGGEVLVKSFEMELVK